MSTLPRQPAFTLKRSDFPTNFVFGTSTSSYQVEGSSFGGCGSSHWDTFSATPDNVVNFENGSIACDHYHLWEQDLDLIKAAGLDAYRFSTSWARILPDGHGKVNEEALDFYDALVDGLLARDIAPHLTLYHWDLPSPLADIGGWCNRDVTDHFADYAGLVAKRLGDRLETIVTFNEPWCVTWLSHYLGLHAPGLRDIRAAARSLHLVPVAHGKAIAAMRAMGQKELGVVLNFEHISPASDDPASLKAAKLAEGIFNRWFLGGFFLGDYPADVVDHLEPYLPSGWQDDRELISQDLDWLGINYYTRSLLKGGDQPDGAALPVVDHVRGPLPRTAMDWEVYPEGLGALLRWICETYTKDIPLVITENGMANDDLLVDGKIDDQERIAYLDAHFSQALDAIQDGVPLTGYFVWSLMDNFEWALGYDKRFGVIHVDFETLARTPKASYHALKDMLAR